ncbi:adenylate/guanylate cyclase domain-containing protein [Chelatococcus reniformis]|uniref:Adenylate/guanylate cyclase domain-containing response regulator n=1 Tax=Chelatococcus reniformis TaxID=1494448 RepID=A0A916XA90_9HYPH|nr:adenylate/guanylate cyclase domain-containing protein [Chelatococcus reniformis]GGC55592.1 adenylate/guanylate cyclase domain-containing response regulator [Chelatococcus reniformis]
MITILVVDDEPDLEPLLLQRFRRQIRAGQLAFLFAHDGVEALSLIESHVGIDVVVSDINMPRMDGLALLERLQQTDEDVSTVIVSAYGDMANIRSAMNRGAFDFVTKPIDFTDLETTIDKTLRHITRIREARQRQLDAERAHAALSRYFSPNLAERLAIDAQRLNGGERRDVTSLFTDVTGFTKLVEAIDPTVLAALLNDYLIGMTDIVFAHEGTVAKIVGDALHVLFGAPGDQPDHASRAVACALELDAFAEEFRRRWSCDKGIDVGATRIGAHAGPAIVGNFGGGRFFDYTAYGDTINTAARLESANKPLGTRICVSANLADRVDGFGGRPIGDLLLRGKAEALRAWEPLSEAALADPATRSYHEAFAKLERNDSGTIAAFAALVGQRPLDGLASYHLKRLLNGATGPRIDLAG